MPTAPQNQAIKVIGEKIEQMEERYDGYCHDLVAALHDILALESDRPHNIVQRTSRVVTALSETLVKKGGNIE